VKYSAARTFVQPTKNVYQERLAPLTLSVCFEPPPTLCQVLPSPPPHPLSGASPPPSVRLWLCHIPLLPGYDWWLMRRSWRRRWRYPVVFPVLWVGAWRRERSGNRLSCHRLHQISLSLRSAITHVGRKSSIQWPNLTKQYNFNYTLPQ